MDAVLISISGTREDIICGRRSGMLLQTERKMRGEVMDAL